MAAERDDTNDDEVSFRSHEDVEFPFADPTPRRIRILTVTSWLTAALMLSWLLGYRHVGAAYVLVVLVMVHAMTLLQPRLWGFAVGGYAALIAWMHV